MGRLKNCDRLVLDFFNRAVVIYGGPYMRRPEGTFGVKLAQEISRPCMVKLDIPDFGVPQVAALDEALVHTLRAIADGMIPYAGCMGGRGRTGLFLACVAKAWGIDNPVRYVRRTYNPHAVETKGQEQFVNDFRPSWRLRRMVWLLKFRMVFGLGV